MMMYWSRSAIGFSIWSDDLYKLQEVGLGVSISSMCTADYIDLKRYP